MAYSKSSDLDIWLCHRPDLDTDETEELQQKALSIEQWANSLRLEVHFFLIDTDGFRRGEGSPISTESCGTTQHYLLLEEFYRTGLFVAGKVPVWWLVPPHQERCYRDYVNHLNDKRFIKQSDIIDFGGLDIIPPEEFLGASLWHLYKAITTPYKSLLKLFLIEAYASTYPDTVWLSVELKRAIYGGVTDLDQLDPYILMYRKVEEYLKKRGETHRLQLARYCFYQKVNEFDAETQSRSTPTLQAFLSSTISGWDNIDLHGIQERKRWRIGEYLEEHKIITKELIRSYKLLGEFSGRFASGRTTESHELKLLGRKLYSVLERKPGKIDVIRADSAVVLHEEELYINEVSFADGEQGWVLFTGETGSDREAEPIKKSRSLLELLAWITLNGLYGSNSNIRLETQTGEVSTAELRFIHSALSKFLRRKLSDSDQLEIYAGPAEPTATALFVNIGQDPLSTREDGLQTASNRGDALSYGSQRTSLICSIDQTTLTSWQETLIYRHLEITGLLDCFCDVLNKAGHSLEQLEFSCYCFSSARSQRIASRIKEVFEHLRLVFIENPGQTSPRFILRGGQEFYVFARIDSAVQYWGVADETQLFAELATPQLHFSPVVFDNEALEASPLPHIYQHNQQGIVQVFCSTKAQTAEVYILDERGSLFYQQQDYAGIQFLLEPYSLFLQAILRHYAFLSDIPIEYYSVQQESTNDYYIERIEFSVRLDHQGINIRVSADELAVNKTAYTIYCNEKEFSSMEYGDGIFNQVAKMIFELRQGEKRFPIHLTDIDVPLKLLGIDVLSQLQTIHLLQYRQKIEQRLNSCLFAY